MRVQSWRLTSPLGTEGYLEGSCRGICLSTVDSHSVLSSSLLLPSILRAGPSFCLNTNGSWVSELALFVWDPPKGSAGLCLTSRLFSPFFGFPSMHPAGRILGVGEGFHGLLLPQLLSLAVPGSWFLRLCCYSSGVALPDHHTAAGSAGLPVRSGVRGDRCLLFSNAFLCSFHFPPVFSHLTSSFCPCICVNPGSLDNPVYISYLPSHVFALISICPGLSSHCLPVCLQIPPSLKIAQPATWAVTE